jgi:hypothetical protein
MPSAATPFGHSRQPSTSPAFGLIGPQWGIDVAQDHVSEMHQRGNEK